MLLTVTTAPTLSDTPQGAFARINTIECVGESFEELERAAVNAEVHFGSELAHHLREPLRAYHRIVVATACRMTNVGLSPETKVSGALVRQWEAVVHAGVMALDDTDELSPEMDEAKRAIEITLRPFVEAPTFGEFLLVKKVLRWSPRRLVPPGPRRGRREGHAPQGFASWPLAPRLTISRQSSPEPGFAVVARKHSQSDGDPRDGRSADTDSRH